MMETNKEAASRKGTKKLERIKDKLLMDDMDIDKEELKSLKKKLGKIAPRPERGVETLFRLVSNNQYTINAMIDRKSNILISINALILSIIIGTVLNQLDQDPHLIYPAIMILLTNLISIGFAVFATRPANRHDSNGTTNPMFYGNFSKLTEEAYIDELTGLMDKGDELYRTIARDTFHLGKTINRKFKLLRKSFDIFLIGIILSVLAFIICHVFFGDTFA